MKLIPHLMLVLLLAACSSANESKNIGSIERMDPSLDQIIHADATVEILGEGYTWSEGPVWIEERKMLLFSDVPANKIYRWTEAEGVTEYLTPSGYTGSGPSKSSEPGSNGLVLDREGKLVLCQHGDRRIARMDAPFNEPSPTFVTIADGYNGKKFNSPNDAVYRSDGALFFTDPPYGLPERENDPSRELPWHGVYKVSLDGKVSLLVDSITRPNGIGLTPDERTLIVANSDPRKPMWYAFDLADGDSLANARIFFDASDSGGDPGLPDGFKIDKQGNVFACGPGGIWIFNPEARLLGKVRLPEATANCALADGDQTLYITSKQYLLRVKMR